MEPTKMTAPTYTGQPYQPSNAFLHSLHQIKQKSVSAEHFLTLVGQLKLTKKQRKIVSEFYESVLNELP
jgi:hypothetical protein